MDQGVDQTIPAAFVPLTRIYSHPRIGKDLTSEVLDEILERLSIDKNDDYKPSGEDFTKVLNELVSEGYYVRSYVLQNFFTNEYKTIDPVVWVYVALSLNNQDSEDAFHALMDLIDKGMFEVLHKADLLEQLRGELDANYNCESTPPIIAKIDAYLRCKEVREEISEASRDSSGVWSAQMNVMDAGVIGSGFEGINAPKAGLVALPTPIRDR